MFTNLYLFFVFMFYFIQNTVIIVFIDTQKNVSYYRSVVGENISIKNILIWQEIVSNSSLRLELI